MVQLHVLVDNGLYSYTYLEYKDSVSREYGGQSGFTECFGRVHEFRWTEFDENGDIKEKEIDSVYGRTQEK